MPEDTTSTSGQTPAAPAAGGESTDTSQEPVQTPSLTTEELDAQWRNRMSQRDKAHAAETTSLREQKAASDRQLATLQAERDAARVAGMSEAERVAAERDALKAQLDQERLARVVDTRKAKYPNIAAELGDEVVAAMDEAKLAALNEKFASPQGGGVPPSLIDPNSSARTGQPTGASPQGKTRQQLLADLESQSPGFAASLGQGALANRNIE